MLRNAEASWTQDAPQAPAGEPVAQAPGGETEPASSPASPFGGLGTFLPLILIFAVFYFVMIGPERKNRKKREAMLAQLKKGDKVMTSGGLYASVIGVQDDVVTLQIAEGVRARFSRTAIQSVLEGEAPAGEAKKP